MGVSRKRPIGLILSVLRVPLLFRYKENSGAYFHQIAKHELTLKMCLHRAN